MYRILAYFKLIIFYYGFLIVSLIINTSPLSSQKKYDNNWIIGYGANDVHTLFNFNNDSLSISTIISDMDLDQNIAISTESGKLIFYSNGCKIYDNNNKLIINGRDLVINAYTNICEKESSFNIPQSSLVIPISDTKYYLINPDFKILISPSDTSVGTSTIFYNLIEFDTANNIGKVTSKSNILLKGRFTAIGNAMVKHSNGKDWWLLFPCIDSNCINIVLFSENQFKNYGKQCFNLPYSLSAGLGATKFSQNGNKFAISNVISGLTLFDFQRCTGKLTFKDHIKLHSESLTSSECEFSPNSKYLYLFNQSKCWQLDITTPKLEDSIELVAEWDGAIKNTRFHGGQIGPDGKIYVSSPGTSTYYHVIESLNLKGTLCNFHQRAILLPTYNFWYLPSYPNYNLGVDTTLCDTLINSISNLDKTDEILIYPNPTTGIIELKMKNEMQNSAIDIYNLYGKKLITKKLNWPQDIININDYPDGIYFISLINTGNKYFSKKIIKVQ